MQIDSIDQERKHKRMEGMNIKKMYENSFGVNHKEHSKWLIFSVTGIANFITGFSSNSITLALPIIAEEFHTTQAIVSWVNIIYSLIPCCSLVIFGKTADIFGYKKQFLFGFALYGLTALFGPLVSDSLGMLILSRAILGIAFSMLNSITLALTYRTFPKGQQATAVGVSLLLVSIGMALSSSISGALLNCYSWRAIFYFCIPFCIAGFCIAFVVLPKDGRVSNNGRETDWWGCIFLTTSATGLSLFLNTINFERDRMSLTVIWLAIFILCGSFFVRRERSFSNPLIDLKMFRSGLFTAAVVVVMVIHMTISAVNFSLTFFFTDVFGLNTVASGMLFMVSSIFMIFGSLISGRFTDHVGGKKSCSYGMVCEILACIMLLATTFWGSIPLQTASLAVLGFAFGITSTASNALAMEGAATDGEGVVSGTIGTGRNLGGAFGVAIASGVTNLYQILQPESSNAFLSTIGCRVVLTIMLAATTVTMITLLLAKKRGAEAV